MKKHVQAKCYNWAIRDSYKYKHQEFVELLWNDNLELYNTLIVKDVKDKISEL